MFFEALVFGRDTRSEVLEDARYGLLLLGRNGLVATAHPDDFAVAEGAEERVVELVELAEGEVRVEPDEAASKASKLVFIKEGAVVVASGFLDGLGIDDAQEHRASVDAL